ncbi:MAG: helix-turn-helix transcriptional regulator [Candidatus Micrarchaeia archaeon]
MDFVVSRKNIEPFGILVLVVGAFLLLISAIKGTYMIIAFIRGIPLNSIYDIRINVINVFFNFIIPFIGGLLLIISGLTMLKYRNYTVKQSLQKHAMQQIKSAKSSLLSSMLTPEEKKILSIIEGEEGMLQSDLVAKSGFSKVKVHRMLKKLESMELIKRSRFGITNRIFISEKQ